ncbi:hypothetical protein BC826DRAFT_975346 [Russula brevipes]|nr:hypothetical protein BC826DRAFT_975346 [Russula brevipes]
MHQEFGALMFKRKRLKCGVIKAVRQAGAWQLVVGRAGSEAKAMNGYDHTHQTHLMGKGLPVQKVKKVMFVFIFEVLNDEAPKAFFDLPPPKAKKGRRRLSQEQQQGEAPRNSCLYPVMNNPSDNYWEIPDSQADHRQLWLKLCRSIGELRIKDWEVVDNSWAGDLADPAEEMEVNPFPLPPASSPTWPYESQRNLLPLAESGWI